MGDKFLCRNGVALQDWIEQRLPNDIAIGLDEHDRYVLHPLVALESYKLDVQDETKEHAVSERGGSKVRERKQRGGHLAVDDFLARLPNELSKAELALATKLSKSDGVNLS